VLTGALQGDVVTKHKRIKELFENFTRFIFIGDDDDEALIKSMGINDGRFMNHKRLDIRCLWEPWQAYSPWIHRQQRHSGLQGEEIIMSLWQKAMIGLARNGRLKRFIQEAPFMAKWPAVCGWQRFRSSHLYGEELKRRKISCSFFYLGEYVEDSDLIQRNVQHIISIIKQLADSDWNSTYPWTPLKSVIPFRAFGKSMLSASVK